jgi:hypothetical protein
MTASPVRELPVSFRLLHGSHSSFEQGACLLEAVAWVAGEPHSDRPECASPALAGIGRALNDRLDDEERQLLEPLILRLVGTSSTRQHDLCRTYVYLDAVVREIVPMGLDAVTWRDLGDRLRGLAPIVDETSARAARGGSIEVRDEARRRRATAATTATTAAAAAAAATAATATTTTTATAAAAAAYAAADAYAAAKKTSEERAQIRSLARRPIVEAMVRGFERAIATEAP